MSFWKWDKSWLVIIICAAAYLLNIFLSTGIYDHSDGLAHFAIARYAPKHPVLFLDHWGKPLFTLLSSPFTLFGIKGVMVFNTILYVLTARILVLLGEKMNLRFLWSMPFLLAAIPVYFQVTMSGLTEVLFAAILVLGLYFFASARYVVTGFLLSFLLFARSEAYLVIPFFALGFALKKQWLALGTLAFAPVLLSVIGWFALGDFWWIIHDNPYVGAVEIYGKGPLWHFFQHNDEITGSWLWYGALAGILVLLISIKKSSTENGNLVLLLIAGMLLAVVGAHSWFWYKGLYGSFGLLRVLATVAPLFVVLFVFAISAIANALVNPNLLLPIPMLVCYLTIQSLLAHQEIVKKPDDLEQKIQGLASWYTSSAYRDNPNVWYMYPAIGYYLGIDNFEKLDSRQLWYLDRIKPSNSIRQGGLIIYDSGHSPLEGNTSKELLFADQYLKLVHTVGGEYEGGSDLMVFEKVLPSAVDTLVDEDFASHRPLLEGRINRISTDSSGRRFFDMITITHYMKVFTFWKTERAFWQADAYELWYEANEPLEVYLSVVYEDGHEEDIAWQTGVFELPEFEPGAVNISVALRNPNPQEIIHVYNWGLRKVSQPQLLDEGEAAIDNGQPN